MKIDEEPKECGIIFENCVKTFWIIGYGGAGKSSLSKILEKEHDFTRIELGRQVLSSYKESAAEFNDQPLSMLDWLRSELKYGEGPFSRRMLRRHLDEHPDDVRAKKIVIPSMRTKAGLIELRLLFPNAQHTLIYVEAQQIARAKRISERDGASGQSWGLEDMIRRDNMEDTAGIKEVIGIADRVVTNNGDEEEFKRKVREFFLKDEHE